MTNLVSVATQRYVPILKWAGGKSSVLAQLADRFPDRAARYYEPFVGSGAVFFYLRGLDFAGEYHLSDINPELINLYQVIRDDLDALIHLLAQHKRNHDQAYYTQIRAMDRENILRYSPVERAARMIYLNRTCFNGLWRVNSKGHFNVPMGRYANPAILDEARLRRVSEALQGVHLSLQGFDTAVSSATAGDFVYFDPPYVPLNPTSNFTSYALDDFGETDQRRLAEICKHLDQRCCNFMLSNSDTPLVHDLFTGFQIITVQAARRINSNPAKRGEISEVVVTNY